MTTFTVEEALIENRRKEREAQLEALRASLPTELAEYLDRIEASYSAIVGQCRHERDTIIAEREAALAPLRAQRQKLQEELKEAKAYLHDIPISATPAEIGEKYMVQAHWPGRIGKLQAEINEHEQAIAAAGRDFTREVDPLRAELHLEIEEACKTLKRLIPNVYEL